MTLAPGTRFGPYAVIEQIGSGGMGEVYRATDTNLKRDVALKVLPRAFVEDADRLARFQREAEVLASLNHPNIAQIYGLEKGDERTALIMEIVEGPTLADRIRHGAIPLDESLGIAGQILDALESAHAKGIVHRDLKPANIKLSPDGIVKVLDFGIAKALDPATGVSGPGHAQLTTPAMTEAGIALGTAAYMSPEQARGRPLDQRADIWAFGCVLYEMLTGQPAFGGEDRTSTLARVLERRADLKALPKAIPAAVRQTISRCLEKDAKQRWHHVGDVRLGLAGALAGDPDENAGAAAARSPRWPAIAAATLIAVIVTAGAMVFIAPSVPEPAVTPRYTIGAPDNMPIGSNAPVAFSPDGRSIAFVTGLGERRQMYAKRRDIFDAQALGGGDDVSGLFPIASGNDIGFFSSRSNQLMRIATDGGAPRGLVRAVDFVGADITADGTIVHAEVWGDPIRVLSPDASEIRELTAIDFASGESAHIWPDVLPDGQHVLFTIWAGDPSWDNASLAVADIATGTHRIVLEGGVSGRYVDSGHIVFWRGDALWAVPFDVARLQTTGDPVRVVPDVRMNMGSGNAHFAISNTGALAFVPGREVMFVETMLVDRNGTVLRRLDTELPTGNPAFSPGGTRVALSLYRGGIFNIGVFDLERNILERVWTGSDGSDPTWIDDERLSFQANPAGSYQEYVLRADGSGEAVPVAGMPPGYHIGKAVWSADERTILYVAATPDSLGIWRVEPGSDSGPELIIDTAADDMNPALSPRGDLIAYSTDEASQSVVYVRPYPDVDARRITIASSGGSNPAWSADGLTLYYAATEGIFEVPVSYSDAGIASFGQPELALAMTGIRFFDLAPDGESFAITRPPLETSAREIRVIEDFVDGLRDLAN